MPREDRVKGAGSHATKVNVINLITKYINTPLYCGVQLYSSHLSVMCEQCVGK